MSSGWKKTIKSAITATTPVFFGYVFVGMAFGLLIQKAGYSFMWAILCSVLVYAGSMQFIMVGMLSSWIGIWQVIVVTFALQIRHMFYGLSLIEKFKGMGRRKAYMIFSLTDETYSLLCSANTPDGVNEKKFFFLISLLNQCYWVAGSLIGATVGELIPFDATGIDFAMSALFIVILIEQWKSTKIHQPAILGIVCALGCLLILKADHFLPPALILVVVFLIVGRRRLENTLDEHHTKEEVQ